MRVAVVVDDEWVRRGIAAALEDTGRWNVTAVCAHDGLAEVLGVLDETDVLLVDPSSASDDWDRFAGVETIELARAARPELRAVALSRLASNPLLRLRLREAKADGLFALDSVRNIDELEVALREEPQLAHPSPIELASFGLKHDSKLGRGIAWLRHHQAAQWIDGTMTPTRRQAISARQTLARLVGIEPWVAGSSVMVERRFPSWKQVAHVMSAARGHISPAATRLYDD